MSGDRGGSSGGASSTSSGAAAGGTTASPLSSGAGRGASSFGRERAIETILDRDPMGCYYRAARVVVRSFLPAGLGFCCAARLRLCFAPFRRVVPHVHAPLYFL
jgi:hypothetical protein